MLAITDQDLIKLSSYWYLQCLEKKHTGAATLTAGIRILLQHQLDQLWQEAKTKLGEAVAGRALQHFMIQNSKLSDFDPFRDEEKAGEPHVSGITGSDDPLTFDVMIALSKLAPTRTTEEGMVAGPVVSFYVPVENNSVIYRIGEWSYTFTMPQIAEGKGLEPWERVALLTVRSTTPFRRSGE